MAKESSSIDIDAIRATYSNPLHSERLALVPYRDEMFDDHLAVRKANYPDLTEAILNLDKTHDQYRSRVLDDDGITYLAYTGEAGELVGEMVVKFLKGNVVELGWDVMPQYRRNGYACEAARRLLSFASKEFQPEHIIVKIDADNGPSIALAKKLGATPLRTEKRIFTELMDERMLFSFIEANQHLITAEVRAVASEFGVDPNTLLTEHLVYEITPTVS